MPNEPRVHDQARQAMLTARYLLPVLPELEAFFLAVRAQVDGPLKREQPVKLGKMYPLGQCLEISLAVQQCLQTLRPDDLAPGSAAAAGYAAFAAFRKAGGVCRQVWGDLRGEFFQNAFQLGTLYLDVSNDTVTPTKPKVEILPFADARFIPVADFRHFARIAARYWQHHIYPNHVLPELAPYCPLIHVMPSGQIMVCEGTGYMVALAQAGEFVPSEAVLCDRSMPDDIFTRVRVALADTPWPQAPAPEEGRAMALRACREHRRKRWHASPQRMDAAIQTVREINRRLSAMTAPQSASRKVHQEAGSAMSNIETVQIDGKQYNLNALSDEARQQLSMVRAADQRLVELQRDLAFIQTARSAYISALTKLLPEAPK
ncbi:hypothetical protein H3H39_18180 [Duganella sp. LX47W]|uniref:Uncharacterized protein n=1 Tax=Rugamonas apoptosis TaxID=2758570 RepID=A0A7W2FC35_9BURK|nr:hypothetical protein [Rugamonas apoptosis]